MASLSTDSIEEETTNQNGLMKPHTNEAFYQTKSNRPRWVLHTQAVIWRALMSLGMWIHRLAPPRPPTPSFKRVIESTVSDKPGSITLYVYVPGGYNTQRNLWSGRPAVRRESVSANDSDTLDRRRSISTLSTIGESIKRRSKSVRKWDGYPAIINFHGGGFVLGTATDDARWCGTVVDECNAVVISVDYRLAPEHPFPTAVEDGVDAVLWVHRHAHELGIDPDKIALTGFSSGGNMTFTVPLRLYDLQRSLSRDDYGNPTLMKSDPDGQISSLSQINSMSTGNLTAETCGTAPGNSQLKLVQNTESNYTVDAEENVLNRRIATTKEDIPLVKIACIVPWYPPVDYTRTRAERRATSRRADHELPALFTDLFDDSYLHPPKDVSLGSPYLSPGVAPTHLLRDALPYEIIMHTCEWDMLLDEGEIFRHRLESSEIGKKVWYRMVPGVPHGWDKAPNPIKPTPGVREHYLHACKELRRVLGQRDMPVRTTEQGPSAAPRGSVSLVR